MISISNYEIALSHLQDNQGQAAPIIALSFALEDLPLLPNIPWTQDNCRLDIVDAGLRVELAGQEILFPLVPSTEVADLHAPTDKGLDRDRVLELIAAHGHLFVCAFSDPGDLVNSIGFELSTQDHPNR